MQIPTDPEVLTTSWLTEALRKTKTIKEARVTAFEVKALSDVAGLTGQLVRLHLCYDRDEEAAPGSLIAKFSIADPELRAILKNLQFYEREVRFYQEIADQVELRTPRCYYSDLNLETYECVLLLEDLAPAHTPDLAEGCTLQEAEQAIRQIAKFHATWWDSPQLETMAWLPQVTKPALLQRQKVTQQRWKPFLEKVGDHLPAGIEKVGQQVVENEIQLKMHLLQPPLTMVHYDYKLDNLFFASDQGGGPFAVADWQTVSRRRGVYDVAFFLCNSVSSTDRRSKEMDWLRIYQIILSENGVEDYSFEQCLFDYQVSILTRLLRLIYILGGVNISAEQEGLFRQIFLPRCCAAILDLNAETVLADFTPSQP